MQRLTITLEVLVGFAQSHRLAPQTPVMLDTGDGSGSHECAELLVEFDDDGSAVLTLSSGGVWARDTRRLPDVSAGRDIERQRAISRALRERSVLNRLASEIIRERGRQIRARAA